MVRPVHAAIIGSSLLSLASCSSHGPSTTARRRHLQEEEDEEVEEEDKSISESINDFFFDDFCDRTQKDTSRLVDLSSWMSTLDPNVQLTTVTLPGTHHSASYDLSTTINPNDPEYSLIAESTYGIDDRFIAPWTCRFALTQSLSLSEQLQAGIRYFDLRIDLDSTTSTFRSFHVLFGLPVTDLLNQIATFCKENPTEIVVVEMGELFNPAATAADKANLAQIIVDAFGTLLLPETADLPTIGSMQDARTTVIVAVQDDEVSGSNALLWDDSILQNTFANTADLSQMIDYNTAKLAEFESESNSEYLFNKLSWTLTPDSEYITDSILRGSLYDLAKEANGALRAFADDNAGRQLGNVLLLDYFETSPLLDVLGLVDESVGQFQVDSGASSKLLSTVLSVLWLVGAIVHVL